MPSLNQRNRIKAQQVTLVGMVVDVILGVVKILIGGFANSHALIADGIHSLSDAATDILVIIITRISHHVPDANHPYGHARFETMGTLLLGSSLIVIALLLAYNYLKLVVTDGSNTIPTWPALIVALLSIISKEWIFRYTKKAGEELRSNLLIANAWHSRTDAFSSIIVLIGIAGSMIGFYWLDVIAALFVALVILKIGGQLVWDSSKELVDTGVEPEQAEQLQTTLLSAEGIVDVHDLRTRRMGQDVLLDVHLQVDSTISVSEGHQIGEWAAQRLLNKHSFINDVIYHIDAEDDHKNRHQSNMALLPLRNKVTASLVDSWPTMPTIEHMTLHYLDNRINVELFIDNVNMAGTTASQIEQELIKLNQQSQWLGTLKVWVN
jgi:cation diffusion facilitator family transporter